MTFNPEDRAYRRATSATNRNSTEPTDSRPSCFLSRNVARICERHRVAALRNTIADYAYSNTQSPPKPISWSEGDVKSVLLLLLESGWSHDGIRDVRAAGMPGGKFGMIKIHVRHMSHAKPLH